MLSPVLTSDPVDNPGRILSRSDRSRFRNRNGRRPRGPGARGGVLGETTVRLSHMDMKFKTLGKVCC